jgi:hypothetical protein
VVENADGHGASSCYIVLLHRPAAAIKYVFVQVVAHTVYHTTRFYSTADDGQTAVSPTLPCRPWQEHFQHDGDH